MDTISGVLQLLTLGISIVTAGTALLILFRTGRGASGEDVGRTVRTEADRIRADAADQARGVRQELADAIRGFQDSMSQRFDAGIEAIRSPITGIGEKLDADIARMGKEAADNREALRLSVESKLDATDKRFADSARVLREELTANFATSSEVLSNTLKGLGQHQQERLEKIETALTAMSERQGLAAESLRKTVEERLDILRTENSLKLDEMRKTVDEKLQTELEKRLGDSFRTVSEQLERVHAGLGEMQTLATGVGDLKKVLSNVKTRGIVGEWQVGSLLEQFLSPEQYVVNAQVKPGTGERVEYAICFSNRDSDGDLLLPIDAKFPQEDYQRLVEASERADIEGMEGASTALEARVRSCAKAICEKYINPPLTTDFAILFLPTEGLFAEVLRRPGLQEQVQRDWRVTIAGPTTLASILNAFQMGFRSLAIQKRSSEVWQILGAVRAEFENHGKVVETLKRQLDTASKTIDRLGTRTNAMNRKLRSVEMLPAGNAQVLLGLPPALPGDDADEVPAEAEE